MPCYHPLKAFPVGVTENGKTKYKICSYSVQSVYKTDTTSDVWYASPDVLRGPDIVSEYIEIPCGRCIGCRLAYSQSWAARCMMELPYHKQSLFLTLTYDDEHLPVTYYGDPETGEAQEAYTLCKRDLQLFMKRLRKRFPDTKLRYFACGEYGGQTFRPHYHLIVFGLDLPDLKLYKSNFNGDKLYNSEILDEVWQHKGFCVIGDVSWESCAYVARYIMKKQKGDSAKVYETFNIQPEFVLMSRCQGIGYKYYLDHKKDILYNQNINISTEKGGKKFRPPRYFDRLYDIEYPHEMEKVRLFRRKVASIHQLNTIRQIDIDYEEYLQQCEDNLISRTKILDVGRSEL